MLRPWRVGLAGALAATTLAGCAPTLITEGRGGYPPAVSGVGRRPPRSAAPIPYSSSPFEPSITPPRAIADLPGWDQEDHAAALAAFQRGCSLTSNLPMRAACARAQALGPVDDATARAFFEANFWAEPLVSQGVLTGYFAPEYPARMTPDADFSAAVRPRPPDLITSPAGLGDGAGRRSVRQMGEDGESWAYPDRAGIELTPPVQALAWMRPEDLFFMQVQGSGVLDLPDGARMRAIYAADNGRPFVPIASAMVRRGLLAPNQASATAIRGWLGGHRADAQAIMDIDPRYVFFSLQPDDGSQSAGAAGVRLSAGRSIAVDPAWHSYGELDWIDAVAPVLAGAPRTYRRLVMALDTGSAIRGGVRADLYTGRGEAAGVEAGRIRHDLHLFKLVPVDALTTGPQQLGRAP